MSPTSMSRPMRAGGFALLGVAAIATVIGTAAALTGDDSPDSAEPTGRPGQPGQPTTSERPGTGEGSATPTGAPTPSESKPRATTTTTEGGTETPKPEAEPGPGKDGPGTGTGAQPVPPGDKGGGKGDSVKAVSVRVYNNSNIENLATKASEDLRTRGWNVVATGNYSDGVIYTTTAYYRPGTMEEAAARQIGQEFGMRVEPRFEGIKDSSDGVIVIVTKDYQRSK